MPVDVDAYRALVSEMQAHKATLVAVSKTKPVADILDLYAAGHRDFGENYVNELLEKQQQLPGDIRWHFIGHLQGNKVKSVVPFIHLIHGVDSLRLVKEIEKQAAKINRRVDCLLQVHIADEETKFGLSYAEAESLLSTGSGGHEHVSLKGLMGMATLTDEMDKVRQEFRTLHAFFEKVKPLRPPGEWNTLSMGMTGDYRAALDEGSNMVRIGSAIFGERN